MCGLRQLATGIGLPTFVLATAGLAAVATVVSVLLELPGVPVTVVVVAPVIVILRASRWRAGDLSLVGLALTLGLGVAYVLDNVFYDDNGSTADQAVSLLLVPSFALALWALVHTPAVARTVRASAVAGPALGVVAFLVASATRDSTFVPVAVAGGGSSALAWWGRAWH